MIRQDNRRKFKSMKKNMYGCMRILVFKLQVSRVKIATRATAFKRREDVRFGW